jgi:hypothetical protein
MNIARALKSDGTCRALTGLDVNAFGRLLENFTWVYNQHVREQHKLNATLEHLVVVRKVDLEHTKKSYS